MEDSVWTKIAWSYDEILTNWSLYNEIKDRIVKHLDNAQKICDQGCGTGIISIALAKHGKIVHGVDNNHYMLARALDKVTSDIRRNLYFKECDALNLDFPENSFEGVASNNVIFYVNDPEQLLKEAYRVLKPEKKLVMVGPRPDPDIEKLVEHVHDEFLSKGIFAKLEKHFDNFMQLNRMMKRDNQLANTYNAKELVKMLQKVGFRQVVEASEDIYLGENYLVAVRK